jgi:hypothetical protein
MLRAECGVARLIDNYKRQACLSIFRELLNRWSHSIDEESQFHSSLTVRIDLQVGATQIFFVTMEMISEPNIEILPTIGEYTNRSDGNSEMSNTSLSDLFQNFNQILECCCTVVFESWGKHDSTSKSVKLEVQGISATLFDEGD